jgi:glyoxylase-like metal-dependent hydrolase (beta-lactamase superfamily II)
MFYAEPQTMAAFAIPGMAMRPVEVDQWVGDGDIIEILGRRVEVRAVPGHSAGSVLYWFCDDGFAVSGDALFKGSIGRTDFPGCSFEQLEGSIRQRIYTLPDATVIYPGHGPATTVAEEAVSNPFVQR